MKKVESKFRSMTAVEKAEFLNDKFFEMDGKLYHRELDHHSKTHGAVGGYDGQGYLKARINGCLEGVHRIIFAMHYGYWPEYPVDHRNHRRDHNHISNLREISHSCNLKNCRLSPDIEDVTGISYDGKNLSWRATVQHNGVPKRLGRHKSKLKAAAARFYGEVTCDYTACQSESSAKRYLEYKTGCDLTDVLTIETL